MEDFSEKDRELIVELAFRLTGSSQKVQPKIEACLVNIRRRMEATQAKDLSEYLTMIDASAEEFAHFISAVTIHTTSWFREMPHFERLRHIATSAAEDFQEGKRNSGLRVLSAGSSSGEEGYSMALVFHEVRERFRDFNYSIEGWDVDPVSVGKANQAIYNLANRSEIPATMHRFLLIGSGKTKGLFTLDKEMRSRCTFKRRSLLAPRQNADMPYDIIFCRNVLIYFSPESVRSIITNLVSLLAPGGHLCLGHSESIDAGSFGLTALGNTTYRKNQATIAPVKGVKETKAVVETVPAKVRTPEATQQTARRPDVILIGASTGGTEVLVKLLQDMPKPCPPIMVVQHIALAFARPFAERLATSAGLALGTPMTGTVLQENHLYMAWDDYHIGVKRRGNAYFIEIGKEGTMHGVRPSVDYLFQSAAKTAFHGSIAAVVLTGMGKDGALGLKALKDKGAMTFVQDEASSTVFGMPREAIMLGAAGFIGTPQAIREQLLYISSFGLPNANGLASA